jgi:hypothetical protein
MSDSATTRMRFETHDAPLALEAAFDGGRLTSDGGLVWLAEADRELGLCEEIASHIPEWRGPSVRHSLEMLVRQRVYQIASGYEDQNDADSLRSDPLLKLVCGRLPETDADLASQPTICRLENAPDARACLHIARALGELYVSERSEGGVPERVLLDFDSTDDPTHGEQEGSYYHGFYKTRMYHPLPFGRLRRGDQPARRCGVAGWQHPRQPRRAFGVEARGGEATQGSVGPRRADRD